MTETLQDKKKRAEWFMNDRFGMFIHWGLYAIPARGEWIRSIEKISVEDYQKYFDQFNPTDYNPKEWAKCAKEAGMKYAVLTAKHHDGFCLFDSKLTDYKSTNTKCKRDLVKEFIDAFRAEGIKVGLYYSLLDWHHKDYPKYNDGIHPMRGNEKYKDEKIEFDNYLKYMHGQIEELCTNYGKIDILWFDFSYGEMRSDKWKAKELIEMVRSHQPDVIIDNRLEASGEGFGSLATKNPNYWSGDFVSPEQIIPPKGITNELGEPIPWELCTTMNNNWGYCSTDFDYKKPDLLIHKLVECVSKGGNMLLNVGPNAKGRFNSQTVEILKGIGTWMAKNGESIYGCTYAGIEKPEWGRYTRNGNKIYAHIFEPSIGPLALTGIDSSKVKSITRIADGAEILKSDSWVTKSYEGILFISLGAVSHFTYPLFDEIDTVIEIECE